MLQVLLLCAIKSHDSLLFDALAGIIREKRVSDDDSMKLLRACLCNRPNGELPDSVLHVFEEVSGANLHYSQEGEDIVLTRMLPSQKVGFFVDIGAHHPLRFSNTYALYRRGWRGINVDATPGSMEPFKKLRPEDINVEAAVSDSNLPLSFHIFREAALNTFNSSLAQEYVETGWERVRAVTMVPRSLASILDEYLPRGKGIDLLSIDVEGEELAVLQSNNWNDYRPQIIIIEALATPFDIIRHHPAVSFLVDKGYELVSRLANSIILKSKS
jgi:FkbM family methyltransferase